MAHSGPVYTPTPPTAGRARTVQAARAGASFGTALAIAISWSVNKSIFWACVHGVLSWLYVIYYALVRPVA
jgi:hypothetical protein